MDSNLSDARTYELFARMMHRICSSIQATVEEERGNENHHEAGELIQVSRTREAIARVMEKYRAEILDSMREHLDIETIIECEAYSKSDLIRFIQNRLPQGIHLDDLLTETNDYDEMLTLLLPFNSFEVFMAFVKSLQNEPLQTLLVDTCVAVENEL